ncbi:hypothetical protein JDV09_22735 [Mycobacterium sp. Y57]|uniref:hypothetical protein n=1 Tax=Mycolicibacterium xanthum TaxID=2796469 RepID=UPI001C859139|nr:hypothetical protein [Mycolicibacterium xanthum]MBX7434889.1 hypothetical protein [Mycolicibacterium xanthum]
MTSRAAARTDSGLVARVAAIASLGAAVIHAAVLPGHWQEWVPAGLFFAAIAAFQLFWALWVLVRPAVPVLTLGIVANLGVIAVWVMARAGGAPFGPHAGEPEAVGAAGICALLLECYVVMGAAWVWLRSRRTQPISLIGHSVVSAGAAAVIAVAAMVGVASGMRDDHHGPASAEADHHSPASAEADHHSPAGDHAPAGAEADHHSPAGDHHSPAEPALGVVQKQSAPVEAVAPPPPGPVVVPGPAPGPASGHDDHHDHG